VLLTNSEKKETTCVDQNEQNYVWNAFSWSGYNYKMGRTTDRLQVVLDKAQDVDFYVHVYGHECHSADCFAQFQCDSGFKPSVSYAEAPRYLASPGSLSQEEMNWGTKLIAHIPASEFATCHSISLVHKNAIAFKFDVALIDPHETPNTSRSFLQSWQNVQSTGDPKIIFYVKPAPLLSAGSIR
jgi:hypothetical protein